MNPHHVDGDFFHLFDLSLTIKQSKNENDSLQIFATENKQTNC
jgi:hypothetical protein